MPDLRRGAKLMSTFVIVWGNMLAAKTGMAFAKSMSTRWKGLVTVAFLA